MDKIREAVEVMSKICKEEEFTEEQRHDKSLVATNTLLNLAQSYLSTIGMPEEMPKNAKEMQDYYDGYNDCLQDCKLHFIKKMEGIEEVIRDITMNHPYCKDVKDIQRAFHDYPALELIITKAIKKLLGSSGE